MTDKTTTEWLNENTRQKLLDGTLPCDPELAHRQRPFIASLEPCNRPVFLHAWHLGYNPSLAREFAVDLFTRHHDAGTAMYTVALLLADAAGTLRIYDVYDGSEWMSVRQQRWTHEMVEEAIKVHTPAPKGWVSVDGGPDYGDSSQ
jgi:hypothetical protein